MPELPASYRSIRFTVHPHELACIAVQAQQLMDSMLQLVRVVGQAAQKVNEPNLVDWVTPYIMRCSGSLDDIQETIRAIVTEQPRRDYHDA